MIDVHILTHGETPEQLERCLASLANQPVSVHVLAGGDEFPPTQGRLRGYAIGDHEFVSYVDPDDWVEPDAYRKLLQAIEGHDAAYGWEWCHRQDGTLSVRRFPHHAFVIRRGLPVDYSLSWRTLHRIHPNRVACVPEPLYHWTVGGRYGN